MGTIDQAQPGPTPHPIRLMEDEACEDAFGTRYIPYTTGWEVGFKVVPADGVVQWIYLNPSSDDDGGDDGGESNVFVYHDEGEEPHFAGAVCYLDGINTDRERS